MSITYIISYAFLIVCMYIGEFLLFGLWYKLYCKSSVSYLTFFQKDAAILSLPREASVWKGSCGRTGILILAVSDCDSCASCISNFYPACR